MLRHASFLGVLLVPVLGLAMGCASPSEQDSEDGNSALAETGGGGPGELVPQKQAEAWASALQGSWNGPAHAATADDMSAWIEAVPGTLAVAKSSRGGHDVTVTARGLAYRFSSVDLMKVAEGTAGRYVVSLSPSVDPRDLVNGPGSNCWMELRPGKKGQEVGVICNGSTGSLFSYIDVSVPGLK